MLFKCDRLEPALVACGFRELNLQSFELKMRRDYDFIECPLKMETLSAVVFERLLASDTGSSPTLQELVERASLAGVALAKHDLEAAALAHRLNFDELTYQQCRLLLALQVGDQQVKAREAFTLLD